MKFTKSEAEKMYAIGVRFHEGNNYFSKAYTFVYHKPIEAGQKVVIPNKGFFTVGKVSSCKLGFDPIPDIDYKAVVQVVDICDN